MIENILIPAIWVGGIALALGVILAVASHIFRVETDERIPAITEALPGANCGGCGFSGCDAYAAAIVGGSAKIGLCPVGGKASIDKISEVMGVEPTDFIEKKAFVLCGGDCKKAKIKYDYRGIMDCAAAERVSNGPKNCSYGCIGYGTCVSVCKFDAISIKNCIAVVDQSKCTACGMCVKSCPRNIIELKPCENDVTVKCISKDKGSLVRKYCEVGCIGCKICENVCPVGAVSVDGVAKIDYNKCIKCGVCAEKCPTKAITIGVIDY